MRHAISLGESCDVAFQLRMHGKENVPHFFDWLATPVEGLIEVIESDFDAFHAEDLEYVTKSKFNHIVDGRTGISLIHQFPYVDFHQTRDFLLLYQDFRKIFAFHARRFREYVRTLPVTLVRRDIRHEQALRLEQAFFGRFPNADARFLYLVHDGDAFRTPHGHARFIPRARGSLGNPEAWIPILEAEGLLYKRYHHSTAEILGLSHEDHSLSIDDRFDEMQLSRAVAENPDHPLLLLELARHYRKKRDFVRGEEIALRSLAIAPDRADSRFELVMSQWRGGKISVDAAADELVALAQRSDHREIAVQAAECLVAAKRHAEARRLAAQAIKRDPLDHRAYHALATSACELGDLQGARRAIANAIALNSRRDDYHGLHNRLLGELAREDDAMETLISGIEKKGRFAPYCTLGWLFAELGQTAEALSCWKAALPLAGPHADSIRRWIENMEVQQLLESAQEDDDHS